jgi:hypothetical protein
MTSTIDISRSSLDVLLAMIRAERSEKDASNSTRSFDATREFSSM